MLVIVYDRCSGVVVKVFIHSHCIAQLGFDRIKGSVLLVIRFKCELDTKQKHN